MRARCGALLLAAGACCAAALLLLGLRQEETVLRLGLYVGSDWDAPYSDYYDMADAAVARCGWNM